MEDYEALEALHRGLQGSKERAQREIERNER
jgi:hypothetical protein